MTLAQKAALNVTRPQMAALLDCVSRRGELLRDRTGWHGNQTAPRHHSEGTVRALMVRGLIVIYPALGCMGVAKPTALGRKVAALLSARGSDGQQ